MNPYRENFVNAIKRLKWEIYMSYYNGESNDTFVNFDISRLILKFFGEYGTHVLEIGTMGTMGSICRKTSYFESSYSYQSYQLSSNDASSTFNDYSGSISGGCNSGFGFSCDV